MGASSTSYYSCRTSVRSPYRFGCYGCRLGDAWTNLIQPFWAIPVLAIAGLKAKDIMGFCIIQLLITGGYISVILLTVA